MIAIGDPSNMKIQSSRLVALICGLQTAPEPPPPKAIGGGGGGLTPAAESANVVDLSVIVSGNFIHNYI